MHVCVCVRVCVRVSTHIHQCYLNKCYLNQCDELNVFDSADVGDGRHVIKIT